VTGVSRSPGRIACLEVPLFPLAARLRSEPELVDEALAVLEGQGEKARVTAATRLARRAGVRPGMTLPQARARLPKLIARSRDPECERAAREALLEVAESFSPRVEEEDTGRVYLDVDGVEPHFPADSLTASEERAARALAAAADAVGLPAWVGIAASKLAARVAAETGASPTVVPAGEEARFLAPLPLARLAPEMRVATTLERWGIRSIGELARLPEAEVSSRLGPAGRELHAVARGIDPRPLTPRHPAPAFREGMELEWPLVALEPFLFVARAALERLCRRVEARGLACSRLELALRLEPDGYDERSLDLPAPTHDERALLTLVRLSLEARAPGAPVAGFSFSAHPDEPRTAQLSLLGPRALSPDRLATTVARLFALLGPRRVGSPRPAEGHRPERFELVPYEPPPPPPVRREPRRGLGLLTVRVLRPPLALEVLTARGEVPDETRGESGMVAEGPPPGGEPCAEEDTALWRLLSVRTLAADAAEGNTRPRIEGRVRVAAGPWRLEEGWWSDEPVARDYWDVELAGGGLYRIYRERESGEWFADGVYD
jgi:protein ImuB